MEIYVVSTTHVQLRGFNMILAGFPGRFIYSSNCPRPNCVNQRNADSSLHRRVYLLFQLCVAMGG